jgi:hypothetical protein
VSSGEDRDDASQRRKRGRSAFNKREGRVSAHSLARSSSTLSRRGCEAEERKRGHGSTQAKMGTKGDSQDVSGSLLGCLALEYIHRASLSNIVPQITSEHCSITLQYISEGIVSKARNRSRTEGTRGYGKTSKVLQATASHSIYSMYRYYMARQITRT